MIAGDGKTFDALAFTGGQTAHGPTGSHAIIDACLGVGITRTMDQLGESGLMPVTFVDPRAQKERIRR